MKIFPQVLGSMAFMGLLAVGSPAMAAVDSQALTSNVNSTTQPSGTGCDVVNLQGSLASGFLAPVEGQTSFAIWVNPTGTGGAGDPGCGGTFTGQTFNLTNVNFTLADATAFGSPGGETGIGTTTYTVSAFTAVTAGDPSSGPGAMIGSLQQTLTMDGSGVYSVNVPLTLNVDQPFFVAIRFDDFNPDLEVASALWDAVARPTGLQWVSSDNAATWTDFTDFFTDGTTGWIDVTTSGDFVPVGGGPGPVVPATELPSLGTYALLALALLLAMAAGRAVVLNRRDS